MVSPGRPHRQLRDPDFRVRFTVAERIAPEELGPLLDDDDEAVHNVARERFAEAREKRAEPWV
ncbi:hypothetical protein [Mesorhizobium sp.]|uniref:hypothetical protein n=1 Tax=Mesorhizobium sp. TaxID=1871066 RepID=UPI00345DE67C